MGFLSRGLIMAVLNVDGTMPLFKDSFIICKSGGPSAGINS